MTTVHTRSTPVELLYYVAGMRVDGDGAPTCYGPKGGLDYLANAGGPGNWYGIVTDSKGVPIIQGPNDPAPGFYVSPTSLQDKTKSRINPLRYVNSSTVPYIAVPKNALALGVALGDLAMVVNLKSSVCCAAIVADVGPKNKWGEGSICLCEQLGIPSSPKRGGCDDGVLFVIFTGTATGWPREPEEMDEAVGALWEQAGDLGAFEGA